MPQLVYAGLGTLVFCICARSWREKYYLVYDVVGSLIPFLLMVQLIFEGFDPGPDTWWFARLGMMMVLSLVLVGRLTKEWPVSGHLSFVLAVVIIQVADQGLSGAEHLLYLLAVPVTIAIRWKYLDKGYHLQTWNALLLASLSALAVLLIFGP